MIYFVDEDIGGRSAFPIALRFRGYQVATLPDATQALAVLPSARDVDLVIIDVMLAPGLDPEERFRFSETRNGLETGLVLLELLIARNSSSIASRAVLLSAAADADLVASIESREKKYSVPYWRKSEFKSPSMFCEKVGQHIDRLAQR